MALLAFVTLLLLTSVRGQENLFDEILPPPPPPQQQQQAAFARVQPTPVQQAIPPQLLGQQVEQRAPILTPSFGQGNGNNFAISQQRPQINMAGGQVAPSNSPPNELLTASHPFGSDFNMFLQSGGFVRKGQTQNNKNFAQQSSPSFPVQQQQQLFQQQQSAFNLGTSQQENLPFQQQLPQQPQQTLFGPPATPEFGFGVNPAQQAQQQLGMNAFGGNRGGNGNNRVQSVGNRRGGDGVIQPVRGSSGRRRPNGRPFGGDPRQSAIGAIGNVDEQATDFNQQFGDLPPPNAGPSNDAPVNEQSSGSADAGPVLIETSQDGANNGLGTGDIQPTRTVTATLSVPTMITETRTITSRRTQLLTTTATESVTNTITSTVISSVIQRITQTVTETTSQSVEVTRPVTMTARILLPASTVISTITRAAETITTTSTTTLPPAEASTVTVTQTVDVGNTETTTVVSTVTSTILPPPATLRFPSSVTTVTVTHTLPAVMQQPPQNNVNQFNKRPPFFAVGQNGNLGRPIWAARDDKADGRAATLNKVEDNGGRTEPQSETSAPAPDEVDVTTTTTGSSVTPPELQVLEGAAHSVPQEATSTPVGEDVSSTETAGADASVNDASTTASSSEDAAATAAAA